MDRVESVGVADDAETIQRPDPQPCLAHHLVVGNEAAAKDAVAAIEHASGKAEAVRLDTADAGSCEKTVAEVAKRLGRLDVLVCNAGISIDALVLRLKDDDFERVLSVNLKGAVACARAAPGPSH